MHPYMHMVVDAREMELVAGLGDQSLSPVEVAGILGMPLDETAIFLQRAFARHVVNRKIVDGETRYTAANFYSRLDPLSMYENWRDVPVEARDAVIEWQLQEFIAKHLPVIEELKRAPEAFVNLPNQDMLLLDEALAMVDAATEHVVVPCDCRAIVMACNRPLEACIRLDAGARHTLERGHGRRLTKEECKALVVDADRAGLMHTGLRTWRDREEIFGFCNCCSCDCYPIRAGVRLGMAREWPRSHYIAQRELEKCEQCGICAQRCHFGAFYRDGSKVERNGKGRLQVLFAPEKCWGCGLCATGCPEGAIAMAPLKPIQE